MRRAFTILALVLAGVPSTGVAQSDRTPAYQRGYLHPQLVLDAEGQVGMLWVKPVGSGHDLLLARGGEGGAFVDPVRVNSKAQEVLYLAHPEGMPGIAAGPEGRIGVSWFDTSGQLQVATSRDRGASFGPSIAVDPGHARPEHAFSDVAFDANGSLFVTWIDARGAPENHEEPAQLYVARIDEGKDPVVRDLTGEFTESICGCCRPAIAAAGRDLTIAFRMTDPDGYRDIHRIRLGADLGPAEPQRLGPPLWEIDGCPMAGPAIGGELVWFLDGSAGSMRLMEATSPTAVPTPVAAATVASPSAPRVIAGSEAPGWMLYLPGDTGGQVLVRASGGWEVLVDDVPPFCTSIALVDGQLLMVGERGGTLWLQAEAVN